MAILFVNMATTTIRSTYSLDVQTVRSLGRLAKTWNVSKSEALRRAIRAAADAKEATRPLSQLEALEKLQKSLTDKKATRWLADVRRGRRAWSRRIGQR